MAGSLALPLPRRLVSPWVVAALLVLAGGAIFLGETHGHRQALLWCIGAAFGFVLHRATFGFAGAFRRLFTEGRTAGVRAQIVLLGLGATLFLPVLSWGPAVGLEVRGYVFPAGVSTILGAFLFGIGMQWAAGCVSGTLYAAGAGSLGALLTLPFAVLGATFAAYTVETWRVLPALPALSLQGLLGTVPALAAMLGVLSLAWLWLASLERRRHGAVQPIGGVPAGGSLWRGPWPLLWGAVGLALLNLATLLIAGRPWGIVAAFPLWGSRLVDGLGLDEPAFWAWWEEPTRAEWLFAPVTADRTGMMAVGLIAGAMLAATVAGRFGADRTITIGSALGSIAGGLLLGFGAVLAGGCNVSAYVSGIASGSLHGWVWIAAALAGNWIALVILGALARR